MASSSSPLADSGDQIEDDVDDVEERIVQAWGRMVIELSRLGVHAGILSAASDSWPLHVRENYEERLDELTRYANQQIDELHQFGEAYDEDEGHAISD